ncbi:tripartite tricarboxylate transporter permease [Oceanobacillus longus]|uniref:Tripartite tricarboxylate transporter permease n=1 Tax=Oceanobacillus longus TaxID=930120 RepID=A0ABV8GZN3_9BACI
MDIFGFDILTLFTLTNLIAILLGTFVGILFGSVPGLGIALTLVLLLPITYNMEPVAGILLLLAAFQGAEYGGSISAIMLNIPGTGAAIVTTFDGHPLAKKSSPGKALGYSLVASTIGGLIGGIALIFLSVPFGKFALLIYDPEYFLLALLGLIGVIFMGTEKDRVKTVISVVLGLMAATVGMDLFTGASRFTLGQPALFEGINVIALIIGMFAISEVIVLISEELHKKFKAKDKKGLSTRMSFKDIKSVGKPTAIGSIIGVLIGIFPGMGSGTSSVFSYSIAKKISKSPETFGKGNPEGIAAAESANNATVGGALIPLFTLGIPGSVGVAIVMGGFIIHGIRPGPGLLQDDSNLVYAIFFGFLLTTLAMYLIGRLITPLFARIVTIPNSILIPAVLCVSLIGVYVSTRLHFYLWFALGFGLFSYVFRKLGYSMVGFIMAFILCPIIEKSLRRTLVLTDGSYSIFVTRGYSLAIVLVILGVIVFFIIQWRKDRKNKSGEIIESEKVI